MKQEERAFYVIVVIGVIVLALIFQLFFRYQYVPSTLGPVWRIDRITHASCILPCRPAPALSPVPGSVRPVQ